MKHLPFFPEDYLNELTEEWYNERAMSVRSLSEFLRSAIGWTREETEAWGSRRFVPLWWYKEYMSESRAPREGSKLTPIEK